MEKEVIVVGFHCYANIGDLGREIGQIQVPERILIERPKSYVYEPSGGSSCSYVEIKGGSKESRRKICDLLRNRHTINVINEGSKR